jgi:hypothetical protein
VVRIPNSTSANLHARTRRSGSGFKLNVQDLSSLTLNLGPNTTFPFVALGVSIDHQPFFTVNATAGANIISVPAAVARKHVGATTVVRINAEMYFSNQMNLESVDLNVVCVNGFNLETIYTCILVLSL